MKLNDTNTPERLSRQGAENKKLTIFMTALASQHIKKPLR
jgi:hypothetical protein